MLRIVGGRRAEECARKIRSTYNITVYTSPASHIYTEKSVNGIYKLRAHAHRHEGSMGAYGTSQGGGAWGAQPPQPRGGLGGYMVICLFVPWFVTGPLRAG